EWRLFGEHHDRTSIFIERAIGHYDEISSGIRDTAAMQGFHCLRNHAQSLSRTLELPSRDGKKAIGLEVIEIFTKGLRGIEAVFAEGEGTGGSRHPGIHPGHIQALDTCV